MFSIICYIIAVLAIGNAIRLKMAQISAKRRYAEAMERAAIAAAKIAANKGNVEFSNHRGGRIAAARAWGSKGR